MAQKPDIVAKYGYQNIVTRQGSIKYIVIHYTAGATSKKGTALANAVYYGERFRGASADFFVDDETIVQYNGNPQRQNTWAVGDNKKASKAGGRLNGICKNANSISIEMCSYNDTGKATAYPNDGHWHITQKVYDKTVQLTRWLMEEYGIDADHVVRHYDVTGKLCPGIVGWNEDSGDVSAWARFQADIRETEQKEDEDMDISKLTDEQLNLLAEKLINALTGEDCYTLRLKANEYAAGLAVPKWGKAEYTAAQDEGITDGTRPWATATRLEMALMAHRVLEMAKTDRINADPTGENEENWND